MTGDLEMSRAYLPSLFLMPFDAITCLVVARTLKNGQGSSGLGHSPYFVYLVAFSFGVWAKAELTWGNFQAWAASMSIMTVGHWFAVLWLPGRLARFGARNFE